MMNFAELVARIYKKGEQEKLIQIIHEYLNKLDAADRNAFMEEVEALAYKISPEEAERIVHNMRPRGQYWSCSQIKDFIKEKGIDTSKATDYYLVMNMAYNDYYDTAKMYGLQSDPEFYFHIAKDFIDDPDAKPLKIPRYFC